MRALGATRTSGRYHRRRRRMRVEQRSHPREAGGVRIGVQQARRTRQAGQVGREDQRGGARFGNRRTVFLVGEEGDVASLRGLQGRDP